MSRHTVDLAKSVTLTGNAPATRADCCDEVIQLRGELAAAQARNAALAADNVTLAVALHKANHVADDLRMELRLANRRDAGVEQKELPADYIKVIKAVFNMPLKDFETQ